MDREAIERATANLSEIILWALDKQGEIKETELFTSMGKGFQIHFIPYSDGGITDVIVAEMNRRHKETVANNQGATNEQNRKDENHSDGSEAQARSPG